ncbi:Efflux pump himE [Hyphodiscus hymeniophilus]|uniref:Efflux pump himE n=1 Tax=Hyphodiscus hymeniophilus TaxID=353542 RepID=A0A9P7AYR0_9HELO|nr:Efflux pump himE [Hyphodiscus hymeniophilus]
MPQVSNDAGCTLGTCPLSEATVNYDPSLAGNALYLAIFGLILLIQALQLVKYRTWSFSCAMMSGLLLEMVGYVGRVQMHFIPFDSNPFLIYLICITIAPVFFTAAIYLTLSRIIVRYGREKSRFSPKAISLTFMACDFIALVLQAAGGAIADTANTSTGSEQGTHIMVGGLAFQVISLLLFIVLAVEYASKVRRDRRRGKLNESENMASNGKSEPAFKRFLFALSLATIFILIRSCFRVAELAKGFSSKLANQEVPFMILEGAMIVLATLLLTAFHPGPAFGTNWTDAGWVWKNKPRGCAEHNDPGLIPLRQR